MRLLGQILTFVPLVVLAMGACFAVEQHYKFATYVPVRAEVLSKRVTAGSISSGNRSTTTYRPKVEYGYQVGGQRYTCDQVMYMPVGASRGWAQGVLDRFRVGQTVEAYHDPANPSKAYLLREAMFYPYALILFPVLLACAGLFLWSSSVRHDTAAPRRRRSGRYMLAADRSMADKRRLWLRLTALCWGAGTVGVAHFLWVGGGSMDSTSLVVVPIYFGLGMIPVLGWLYFKRLAWMIGDAIVTLDRSTHAPGAPLCVEIDQPAHRGFTLNHIVVSVVGEKTAQHSSGGKTVVSTDTFFETTAVLNEGERVPGLGSIHCETQFVLPADAELTTYGVGYPWVTWSILVHTDIPDAPDYRAEFPFRVVAEADSESDEARQESDVQRAPDVTQRSASVT